MKKLFNACHIERVIPKYNYAGTITLAPKAFYPIEDKMVKFYTPFQSVGVIILEDAEEVKEAVETEEKSEVIVEPKEEVTAEKTVVEETPVAEEKVEEDVKLETEAKPVKRNTRRKQ